MNLWKPWYMYRPQQLLLRLVRGRTAGPRAVRLPWGLPLHIDPRQVIGRSIWRTGVFDLLVSEALFRLVDEGDLVVDAGANIGYTCSILGLCAGRRGELLAFEPHPAVFRLLQVNTAGFQRSGRFASVHLYEAALGDHDGEAGLFLPDSFTDNDGAASIGVGSGGLGQVSVASVRLDTMLGDRKVGLLKIDVEGCEEQVLRGAERALHAKTIRDILYEDFAGPTSAVSRLLAGCGYTLFRLERRMNGVLLLPIESSAKSEALEAPSYLATLCPERPCDGALWAAGGRRQRLSDCVHALRRRGSRLWIHSIPHTPTRPGMHAERKTGRLSRRSLARTIGHVDISRGPIDPQRCVREKCIPCRNQALPTSQGCLIRCGDGAVYLYACTRAGQANVERMTTLARAGQGPTEFVSRPGKKRYARQVR